jgi:ABC-2 type transport system ATP-binding protein
MGKTIFFSTHILSDVAEICTRVGIIEAGKLLTLGSLEELHLQVIPHRLIEVTVLDRLPQALELLERNPLVSEVKAVPAQELFLRQRLEFEFIGGDSELSQLLHQLILLEIPVLHFSENTRNLEEVFLQATQGIVS